MGRQQTGAVSGRPRHRTAGFYAVRALGIISAGCGVRIIGAVYATEAGNFRWGGANLDTTRFIIASNCLFGWCGGRDAACGPGRPPGVSPMGRATLPGLADVSGA